MMILDLRFQIFDLPDLFDFSLSSETTGLEPASARKCIVIPGKLGIASATRKPGSSKPSGYQLEFILQLAKVWYDGSFLIIEKCKI